MYLQVAHVEVLALLKIFLNHAVTKPDAVKKVKEEFRLHRLGGKSC